MFKGPCHSQPSAPSSKLRKLLFVSEKSATSTVCRRWLASPLRGPRVLCANQAPSFLTAVGGAAPAFRSGFPDAPGGSSKLSLLASLMQ